MAGSRAVSMSSSIVTPASVSLLLAASRMPVMRAGDTPNSAVISPTECDRLQPNPKCKRTTFSCRGVSLRKIFARRSESGSIFMKIRQI